MTETTAIEVAQEGHLGERMRYAQALATADLLPAAYRRKPANILLAMEYGHALGLDTITAIQQVHVIEGKPTASAQLIGGLVRRAGHRLRVTGDDKHAVAEIIRRDDPDFVFRAEWTIGRAQAANLTNKGPWKQYPAAMLKARAITEVARDACPEALAGVAYTAEELGADDFTQAPAPAPATDPWAVTEPAADLPAFDTETGEVVEAEIVDEQPAPEPAKGPGVTQPQLKAIHAIFKRIGVEDRDERHIIVSRMIKRDIMSAEELTKSEASLAIDTLGGFADSADPITALDDWLTK